MVNICSLKVALAFILGILCIWSDWKLYVATYCYLLSGYFVLEIATFITQVNY